MVAIHEKIFTPVARHHHRGGDEIALHVEAEAGGYMWCAHTMKPTPPIATMA